jgi:DNA-binding LytR/AlgR family response regulator
MLKCILVEDDPVATEILSAHLATYPDLALVAVCPHAEAALPAFIQHEPDVLLLDIELPGMNGFDLLAALPSPPATILITSHPAYAVQAFEYQVADFIVKPVTQARLAKALQRVRQLVGLPETRRQLARHLFVRTGEEYTRFAIDEVLWFEARGNASRLQTRTGEFDVPLPLHNVERCVGHTPLLRVQRGYIVNLEHVELFEPPDSLKINGRIIPVGRVYRKRLLSVLPFVR